jgi:tetratricopeptide (TPR) repeat protein
MGNVDRVRRAGLMNYRGLGWLAPVAFLLLLAGCASAPDVATAEPEATSLLGEPLFPPPLAQAIRAERESQLDAARKQLEASPDDPEALIWFGRRTAYLGRYRDAVKIFTEGVERFPDEARMLRHRGHRYITLRRFADAVQDLEQAAALIEGTEDSIEPDGLPNARNTPTSTLHSNIWYHLGLAYFLQNDLDNAARCYRACMKVSTNPDMLSATSHWLYMTLRRQGRASEAAALLEPIHADMDIIENGDYHRLLLMYKGELASTALLPEAEDGLASATVGYGVANWQRTLGLVPESQATLLEVIDAGQWAAFGTIAAEADLSRWVDGS